MKLAKLLGVVLGIAIIGLCGCDSKTDEPMQVGSIRRITPIEEFCYGKCGSTTTSIRFEVLSKPTNGLFGGAKVMENVTVVMTPRTKEFGTTVLQPEVKTDGGGAADFKVKFGNHFGDEILDVYLKDDPAIRTSIRIIPGMEISGNNQEIRAGEVSSQPISVILSDAEGKPLKDVCVLFSLDGSSAKKSSLTLSECKTNEQGVAQTQLETDPSRTGAYLITCQVYDEEKKITTLPITIKCLAVNAFSVAVVVVGGLAIFILGMTMMSDGLQQVAGEKLKNILKLFTRNRFTALLTGAVVTGLMQSSSATTVMVVGFINAGLLTLAQATGIILGANIGSTLTAQIISFKLDSLALPSVIIGMLLTMCVKKSNSKGFAKTILGFGLLFFGMSMMSSELKGLGEFPSMAKAFQIFDCTPVDGVIPIVPILGAVFVGTILTMMIQSSAATVGLAIAMASCGLLNFYTAFPLILGDNIGTTITAQLASLNANRAAKQAAWAHTMFNTLGTLFMIALLYVPYQGEPVFLQIVNSITAGNVFNGENIGRHIASAHTMFNVINVLVFIPLIPFLVWFCERIVPINRTMDTCSLLEPLLLATPTIALEQSQRVLAEMTKRAWTQARLSFDEFAELNVQHKEELLQEESYIDKIQRELTAYMVEITKEDLAEHQRSIVPEVIHCANDAERISDRSVAVMNMTESLIRINAKFSDSAKKELEEMVMSVQRMADLTIEALQDSNVELRLDEILELEYGVNRMCKQNEANHISRIQKGDCTVDTGFVYVEAIAMLERIADHLVNIAERIPKFRM